jgi:5-formaminoimidazole-4-carboxamide-1-beta-D-ribofuranosyl 5'-monophosphate synthetase
MVFECQSAIDASAAVKGTVYDVAIAAGVAGRSGMELTTDSNHDLVVYEIPQKVGNDPTLIHASYHVYFA